MIFASGEAGPEFVKNPAELLQLSDRELELLAGKVRERIIQSVSVNGGHLAPSLGVVELTLALLGVFDPNSDRMIWDVGHQAYAYKLLTGRADRFDRLRKLGGISGFPKMDESKYDHFGVGHSSTSISAALGMALARDLANERHHVIAVIGDGSLTGGEAFEGLNLAGHMGRRLVVVLNDNEMSISPNVGALSLFLSRALSSRWLRRARRDALKFLHGIPRIGHKLALYAMRGEWSFKSFFTPGMLFEALRFTYIGPINGHDISSLRRHLRKAAAVEDGPVLVHVRTRKGKGYAPAENNPTLFHGVAPFDIKTGLINKKSIFPSFTSVFGQSLVRLGKENRKIIAITAAMPEGTGTDQFRKAFPDRFIDAGICEQHAVTFAAGLASQGYRPVLAIYSTFLQRGYDQIVHDICLQNLPVVFAIDRAGIVGEDGATHHGAFDICYLRHIPNISILAPRDENMLQHCLYTALRHNSPVAFRYPRGAGFGVKCESQFRSLEKGRGQTVLQGRKAAIIAAGNCVYPALEAARIVEEKTGAGPLVFDPVWLKPLPTKDLEILAKEVACWVVVEEGARAGGFGSAILEFLNETQLSEKIRISLLGLPDEFIQHGTQEELRALAGLDAKSIAGAVLNLLADDKAINV